ncbi:hypothetical protein Tco_0491823 [Tanacetum coccineum]
MTDYSLWEVIKNGNKVLKRTVGETKQEYKSTTAEEKQDRGDEMKSRGTLLMALLNNDQLKFHSYKDAKFLMEAIEIRYEGNKESKKVQRTLLKQQYENFAGSSSETMDQTFNRNKEEIKTISLDDLYNNLKIYEPELAGSSSISQNPQNVAFVSFSSTNSNCNSSTNEADNTAHGVSATHTQCNSTSEDNLKQIDPDDLEEMDLQWEMAMLTIRARRFIQRTGRKLDVNGQRVGFDRIIVVTHVNVVKKYDYGYLDEIIVLREDHKLYKFKEGDFPRLNLHDLEDMLLFLVQKKLSNLERDDLFDLSVALWMFTRHVVILKRVEDLQLRVEKYQKKLNISKHERFRSDITKMTPYTAYNDPQGIICLDKPQRNKLMRLDKLYKFSDGTLSFVRRVLHDIASSLEMDYLPKRIWSKLDRKRSRIMIKAFNQQLFKRRLMRNLEKFVGGREYGNDFRLLERTI